MEPIEQLDQDHPWSENSPLGRFSEWNLKQRPAKISANEMSISTCPTTWGTANTAKAVGETTATTTWRRNLRTYRWRSELTTTICPSKPSTQQSNNYLLHNHQPQTTDWYGAPTAAFLNTMASEGQAGDGFESTKVRKHVNITPPWVPSAARDQTNLPFRPS